MRDDAVTVDAVSEAPATDDAWFALEHRPGPALTPGGSVFAHPLFAEHVAFLGRLADRGVLVAAGPRGDADGEGMTVVRVPADQAGQVLSWAHEEDQSVAQGLLVVTVRPWLVRLHRVG